MIKAFISQPMRDKSNEEILAERAKAVESIKWNCNDDVEIIESFFQDMPEVKSKPLLCLGKSIELLANADVAYFCKDWEKYRGCRIENRCAIDYGIDVIEDYRESEAG